MIKRKYIFTTLFFILIISLTACNQLDVVGNISITSFKKILDTIPDKVSDDKENGGWTLNAPDGSARFIWSKNFSKSKVYDVMIEFDAKPFLDAGLDVNKLPKGLFNNGKIMVGTKLGNENIKNNGDLTPIESYKKIVALKRLSIKYHNALGHFGIDLGNGNVFEWAKDMNKNDKDIVFALNPKIFTDAGVDPNKVAGWIYAKVKTMDENGKPIEVNKLLKPFNLK